MEPWGFSSFGVKTPLAEIPVFEIGVEGRHSLTSFAESKSSNMNLLIK